MAGAIHFKDRGLLQNVDGLFWQIQWKDWDELVSRKHLPLSRSHINVAEYVALLLTCETFAEWCQGKFTYCELDNVSAQSWFEAAPCPIYPIDRLGHGAHLLMLDRMKVRTRWVPSAANHVADLCSRRHFSMARGGHSIAGLRWRKVKPLWQNVLKFILHLTFILQRIIYK